MTRKDKICQAAQNYSDSMDEFQRYHTYPRNAFIDGAKWADEHPKEGMVSLDKVCDLLYDMLQDQYINDELLVGTYAYENVRAFVEDFCKTMKE